MSSSIDWRYCGLIIEHSPKKKKKKGEERCRRNTDDDVDRARHWTSRAGPTVPPSHARAPSRQAPARTYDPCRPRLRRTPLSRPLEVRTIKIPPSSPCFFAATAIVDQVPVDDRLRDLSRACQARRRCTCCYAKAAPSESDHDNDEYGYPISSSLVLGCFDSVDFRPQTIWKPPSTLYTILPNAEEQVGYK